MPILGWTTTVVMMLLLLFQIIGSCVALVSLRKQFLEAKSPTSAYSVLSSLHIGGTKYSIYSIKIETDINNNIHRTFETIEYNTIMQFSDDKGVFLLPVNFNCIVIVVEYGLLFLNMPFSINSFFSETNEFGSSNTTSKYIYCVTTYSQGVIYRFNKGR